MVIRLFFVCFIIARAYAANAQSPFAVVELFTSEGCSSCPPAEKVLQELKAKAANNKQNIFFLEYHVDYWNRLGWKDPYSSLLFTKRQENYTSVLAEPTVYTPMVLVNGAHPVTGSHEEEVKANISTALSERATIQLSASLDSVARDTLFLEYQSSKADNNYLLRVAITEDNLTSKINNGENSGKTLQHESVVRIFTTSELKEDSSSVKIPLKKFVPNKNCKLILFIQHKQTMKILAATSIALK